MGVISFRAPQEGLEQLQKAVDLIALIKEIVENPNVGKIVKDLSDELEEAQKLSDEKKKEVLEAQEIIIQSKEVLEDFEKQKAQQVIAVRNDLQEVTAARGSLESEQKQFASDKLNTQKFMDKMKSDAEEKLNLAKQIQDDVSNREKKLKDREIDISSREGAFEEALASFEDNKKLLDAQYASKMLAYQIEVSNLANERTAFDMYRKNIEAALKG